jgi:hypothetical protein
MREATPSPERYASISLDEHIFDNLEAASSVISPEEKLKETLDEGVISCRKESFNFAERVLDRMLGREWKKEEAVGGLPEPVQSGFSHDILSKMGGLAVVMDVLNIPKKEWPTEQWKIHRLMELAALKWALGSALNYEDSVGGRGLSETEALKNLHLTGVVESDYLDKNIISKVKELPEEVRKHLFE